MIISPIELIYVCNAASQAINKYPEMYTKLTKDAITKIANFVWSEHWDEPDKEVILIDELPF